MARLRKSGVITVTWNEEVSDLTLLSEYRLGSQGAFERLYQRHRDALYHHARTLAGDDARAEDLVNAAFLRLVRFGDAETPGFGGLAPFLHKVLRGLAIDERRSEQTSRRRERIVSDRWVRAGQETPDPGQIADLNRSLSHLPPEQRETVLLHVYADLTFQEISEVTGESINTVSARYRYALTKMSKFLGGEA